MEKLIHISSASVSFVALTRTWTSRTSWWRVATHVEHLTQYTPTCIHPHIHTFLHAHSSTHLPLKNSLTHTHLILDIHSLTYEPHGHICYTHLTPLNSLNSSHSPHLTQPISFTFVPTSTVSFSDVFLFSVPFSVLNLCLIKLLTCGVIRSYNYPMQNPTSLFVCNSEDCFPTSFD